LKHSRAAAEKETKRNEKKNVTADEWAYQDVFYIFLFGAHKCFF
jgi:hypothetical protein